MDVATAADLAALQRVEFPDDVAGLPYQQRLSYLDSPHAAKLRPKTRRRLRIPLLVLVSAPPEVTEAGLVIVAARIDPALLRARAHANTLARYEASRVAVLGWAPSAPIAQDCVLALNRSGVLSPNRRKNAARCVRDGTYPPSRVEVVPRAPGTIGPAVEVHRRPLALVCCMCLHMAPLNYLHRPRLDRPDRYCFDCVADATAIAQKKHGIAANLDRRPG